MFAAGFPESPAQEMAWDAAWDAVWDSWEKLHGEPHTAEEYQSRATAAGRAAAYAAHAVAVTEKDAPPAAW